MISVRGHVCPPTYIDIIMEWSVCSAWILFVLSSVLYLNTESPYILPYIKHTVAKATYFNNRRELPIHTEDTEKENPADRKWNDTKIIIFLVCNGWHKTIVRKGKSFTFALCSSGAPDVVVADVVVVVVGVYFLLIMIFLCFVCSLWMWIEVL